MTDRIPCCLDCGRLYGDEHGFPDLIIPHAVWKIIAPDDGLLCPCCICKRAHDAGIRSTAQFMSGPFSWFEPQEGSSDD